MKKGLFYSTLFVLFSFTISCSLQDHVLPAPDVYIAGYEKYYDEASGFESYTAKYWKNDKAIILESSNYVIANSIAVSGNDVYVVGTGYDSEKRMVGKLWKNGTLQKFDIDQFEFGFSDIAIAGKDIYISGAIRRTVNSVVESHALYWKNGIPIDLPGDNAGAASIAVSGGDVYVAGTILKGGTYGAVYWKNGVLINLPNGQLYSQATSIAVSGNDVYVSGNVNEDYETDVAALYWKNGIDITLASAGYFYRMNDIAMSGNNVYIAGLYYGQEMNQSSALVFQNGPSLTFFGVEATGVTSVNGDLYVAGYDNPYYTDYYIAKYWKNGIAVLLSNSTAHDRTTGIFVANP